MTKDKTYTNYISKNVIFITIQRCEEIVYQSRNHHEHQKAKACIRTKMPKIKHTIILFDSMIFGKMLLKCQQVVGL